MLINIDQGIIVIKTALKIVFHPIQLKWLITIIRGAFMEEAKTSSSRAPSPRQRTYHRFPAAAFPVSLLHEFSPRVTGCADRPSIRLKSAAGSAGCARVYTPREKIKASGKIGGGNCYRLWWCHSDYWESEKLQCALGSGFERFRVLGRLYDSRNVWRNKKRGRRGRCFDEFFLMLFVRLFCYDIEILRGYWE